MSNKDLKTYTDLRETAATIAVQAGKLAVALREEALARSVNTKSSDVDIVTYGDTEVEKFITAELQKMRPDDAIGGEEGVDIKGSSGVFWSVDPIDGTVNYLYGIPAFSVSLAAVADGHIVAGAVYNPVLDELYCASKGGGATLRLGDVETLVHCSAKDELATALIATGFGYDTQRRVAQAQALTKVLPQVRDIRRMGSCALDLCAVAAGRVDAYYETGVNFWDCAAGVIIANEAGAVHHGVDEQDCSVGDGFSVANPALLPKLQKILPPEFS